MTHDLESRLTRALRPPKPTALELRALREVANDRDPWSMSLGTPDQVITAALARLSRKGLVVVRIEDGDWFATDAGRAALKESEGR